MAARNEITIGPDANLNGLVMYRKVNDIPFTPYYYFDENDNLEERSSINVNYLQYYKNSDGQIVPELTKKMYYVVANLPDWQAANEWFNELAKGPVNLQYGIMDKIEYTLANLPMNVSDGYVLQSP